MESFRLANATPPTDLILRCLVNASSLIHLSESSESESLLRRSSSELVDSRSTVAESLAAELIAKHDVAGKKMLLLRADIARPALPELLAEAGAEITEHVIYQTKLADGIPEEALLALREKRVDWVTFTSSSTARNMVDLLGSEKDLLKDCKLASIGPITSKTMTDLGLPIDVEASQSDIPGLVSALVAAVKK